MVEQRRDRGEIDLHLDHVLVKFPDPDCFEQGRGVFLAVGQRTAEGAGGAARPARRWVLKQAGALRDRELCDPVQFVHVVEGEREDEAERNSAGAQAPQPRRNILSNARGEFPHEIMRLGYAVEADCDQVAISLGVSGGGRSSSMPLVVTVVASPAVCASTPADSPSDGVPSQRLSARHREDPVADRSRIGDDPHAAEGRYPARSETVRPGVGIAVQACKLQRLPGCTCRVGIFSRRAVHERPSRAG